MGFLLVFFVIIVILGALLIIINIRAGRQNSASKPPQMEPSNRPTSGSSVSTTEPSASEAVDISNTTHTTDVVSDMQATKNVNAGSLFSPDQSSMNRDVPEMDDEARESVFDMTDHSYRAALRELSRKDQDASASESKRSLNSDDEYREALRTMAKKDRELE